MRSGNTFQTVDKSFWLGSLKHLDIQIHLRKYNDSLMAQECETRIIMSSLFTQFDSKIWAAITKVLSIKETRRIRDKLTAQ